MTTVIEFGAHVKSCPATMQKTMPSIRRNPAIKPTLTMEVFLSLDMRRALIRTSWMLGIFSDSNVRSK